LSRIAGDIFDVPAQLATPTEKVGPKGPKLRKLVTNTQRQSLTRLSRITGMFIKGLAFPAQVKTPDFQPS
jgi:hypothetical protein